MTKYVIIDEHGELFFDNLDNKISSPETSKQILKNLKLDEDFTLLTAVDDEDYIVESFDFPLKIHALNWSSSKILLHADFDLFFEAHSQQWSVDQRDQFCGLTTSGAPFKLAAKAQDQLFSICDKYDDESFTIAKKRFSTPTYYSHQPEIRTSQFWSELYRQKPDPPWDMNEPAPAFVDMLPRLKLPKSKILVIGCGKAHDAALFAQAGHVVTAIDFSLEAITEAKRIYGHIPRLNFEHMDVFNIPHDWNFTFDLIIEHTLFCAIDPLLRKNIVSVWKRLLHDEGQLMAVFFTMFKRIGVPYGASEYELRELLLPHFQFLFWGRLRNSHPARLGRELFVLAKKR